MADRLLPSDFPDIFRSVLAKGISALEWAEFEGLAATVFALYDYYEVETTPATNDQGIDLILHDRTSGVLDVAQCKHWKEDIGAPQVRDFYGAMVHFKARKGYIVINAGASKSALEFAREKPIVFLTCNDLVDRILTLINVGASKNSPLLQKRI
jgi:restriction system protein